MNRIFNSIVSAALLFCTVQVLVLRMEMTDLGESLTNLRETVDSNSFDTDASVSKLARKFESTKKSVVALQGLDKYVLEFEESLSEFRNKMDEIRQLHAIAQETSTRIEYETISLKEEWNTFKSNLELREFENKERFEAHVDKVLNEKISMFEGL